MTDTVAIPVNHQASAQSTGHLLPDVVVQQIDTLITMKEDVKVGPLTLRDTMEDAGVDFAVYPVIGSTKGNNPHHFKMTSETGREIDGNYFKEAYKGTEPGKLYLAKLDDIKLAANPDTATQSKFYLGKGELFLKDEKNMLAARINAGARLLETAVALYQQELNFKANVDEKKVHFGRNTYTDETGVEHAKRSRTPYVIWDKGNPANFQRLTIEQFLSIDVATANLNGGNFAALKATLSKNPLGVKTSTYKVNTVDNMFDLMAVGSDFLDNGSEEGRKRIERFRNRLQGEKSEQNILRFGDFMLACDAIWEEIGPEYRKLSAKRRQETRDVNATHVKTA